MAKNTPNTPTRVHIVFLTYYIMFDDSDDGRCYAGDGKTIVKAFSAPDPARRFSLQLAQAVEKAAKERIVFPIQPGNIAVKELAGFDLHDIDNAENFSVVVESVEIV